jgi:hypothetical protein
LLFRQVPPDCVHSNSIGSFIERGQQAHNFVLAALPQNI